MKWHNFQGLGAGHGVQRKHRSPCSIGACATPCRVCKGVRMAGRMGGERTTTLKLTAIYQWPEIVEAGGLAAYGPRQT